MSTPAQRFQELIALGDFRGAFEAAEKTLDAGPSLDDLRAFRTAWSGPDSLLRLRQRGAKGLSAAGLRRLSPWPEYYAAILQDGPEKYRTLLGALETLPSPRYAWMYWQVGYHHLNNRDFLKAEDFFKRSLSWRKPSLWMLHGHLCETYLCLGRAAQARKQLALMVLAAPSAEKGHALGWRGEIKLWSGDYGGALFDLSLAVDGGGHWAYCWKGAAELLSGRPKAALATLDEGLRRQPGDDEAVVWRGETLRALKRYEEALEALSVLPNSFWARVNRSLIYHALGREKEEAAEYEALSPALRHALKKETGGVEKASQLRKALELARGYRREDPYGEDLWLLR